MTQIYENNASLILTGSFRHPRKRAGQLESNYAMRRVDNRLTSAARVLRKIILPVVGAGRVSDRPGQKR